MLRVTIDTSGLQGLAAIERVLEEAGRSVGAGLAQMLYAKAVELASQRLHTRREMYVRALHAPQEVEGVWVLALDASARWIEEGMQPHSMLDALLASPKVKHAKDGSRYLVVPFSHGPGHGATNTTPAALDLVNTVRQEMKAKKIPWGAVERDDQGRPKIGVLHRFDVDHRPLKTHVGPGQGWGPVGDTRQGPNQRQVAGGGPGGGGTPFLHGVQVSQRVGANGKVGRAVSTFRIASSKHYGTDRWRFPGVPPVRILDDVHAWALETLDREILPDLVAKLDALL